MSQVITVHLHLRFSVFLVLLEMQVRLVWSFFQSACVEPLEWDGYYLSRTIVSTLKEEKNLKTQELQLLPSDE